MTFRKYFAVSAYSNYAVIMPSHHGSLLTNIDALVEEAFKDYPNMTREDITIKVYNEDWCKHVAGIEFKINAEDKLNEYIEIEKLPKTFN